MSGRGGSAPYRSGYRAELIVRRELEAAGWHVQRAWGSKGPYDLIAIHAQDDPALVQVKAYSARMGPGARRELAELAAQHSATAVLAHYASGRITWTRLLEGDGTDEWTP